MRLYVAVTDKDWFALHASKPEVEEVNFWRPSPDATFKALQPGERTLPVLEAVHIKPYPLVKRHELPNGLLMRSDLHRLFDEAYLTVDPKDRSVLVSKRIREEFENGKDYYKLQGQVLRERNEIWAKASLENLEYHAHNVFR
jgi:putative restriction endonuclease